MGRRGLDFKLQTRRLAHCRHCDRRIHSRVGGMFAWHDQQCNSRLYSWQSLLSNNAWQQQLLSNNVWQGQGCLDKNPDPPSCENGGNTQDPTQLYTHLLKYVYTCPYTYVCTHIFIPISVDMCTNMSTCMRRHMSGIGVPSSGPIAAHMNSTCHRQQCVCDEVRTCPYACPYACLYTCLHTFHEHLYACLCTCLYTCLFTCLYLCTYPCTCLYTCL